MQNPSASVADGGSVARVRAALLAAGHEDTIRAFPAGTRSAVDAATAIGCTVGQIAKSIVFRAGDQAAILVVAGDVRVDPTKAAHLLGRPLARADARFVRESSGFAIGSVSPIALASSCRVLVDESLRGQDPIWAAAGSPMHVFRTDLAWLLRLTGAPLADIADHR